MKSRWIAVFLMAVFVFIHVAKVLHSHENSAIACIESKAIAQVEKWNDCDICDFHFTKDSNHTVASYQLKLTQTFPIQHVLFQSRVSSSVGLSYSDRGPPAVFI